MSRNKLEKCLQFQNLKFLCIERIPHVKKCVAGTKKYIAVPVAILLTILTIFIDDIT